MRIINYQHNSILKDLKSNFDQSKITTEIKEINQDLNQNIITDIIRFQRQI